MPGFGAGFAKGLSGQLDAAGKLHQQEQMRAREYERAKADRQAERLEDRAWAQEDRAALRQQQIEDKEIEYGTKVEFYSKDSDGNLWYTSPRTGEKKKMEPGSPMARQYDRVQIKDRQDDERHNIQMEASRASIAASRESAATSRFNRNGGSSSGKGMNEGLNALISSLAKNTEVTYAGGKFVQEAPTEKGKEGKRYYQPGQRSADAVKKALDEKYGGTGLTLRGIAQKAEAGDEEAYVFIQSIAPHLTFASDGKYK